MEPRHTYRFAPLDRTGWLLGLNATQCLIVASGILVSGIAMQATSAWVAWISPVALTSVGALAQWNGRFLYERVRTLIAWTIVKRSSLLHWTSAKSDEPPHLLASYRFSEVDGIGIIVDARRGLVSGTLRMSGPPFTLLDVDDQAGRLDHWGQSLVHLAASEPSVVQIAVTESTLHGNTVHPRNEPATSALHRSYQRLVAHRTSSPLRHEVNLTLTVARRCGRGATLEQAGTVLVRSLRNLRSQLLENGDYFVDALSGVGLESSIKRRLLVDHQPGEGLSKLIGSDAASWPTSMTTELNRVRSDTLVHRAFLVVDWPTGEVAPDWIEPFIMAEHDVTRTLSVIAAPVPVHKSRSRITRDATRLATDEEQRTRAGFRVGADHRQHGIAVGQRESELLAGHVEVDYVGVILISANSDDSLELDCAAVERSASRVGLHIRQMDAAHDAGLLCALPIPYVPRRGLL